MNYYEELGLTAAATPEEIRQAYKHLARVLHPDQQVEEPARRLAELQMKRLNAIYAVLSDPDRRRAYSLTLAAGAADTTLVAPAGPPAAGLRRWQSRAPSDVAVAVCLAGAALVAGGLYWVLTANPQPRSTAARAPAPPAETVRTSAATDSTRALTQELDRLRRRLQAVEAERDAARRPSAEARAATHTAAPPAGEGAAPLPDPPAVLPSPRPVLEPAATPRLSAAGALPAPALAAVRTGAARFAGTWFYSPPRLAPPNHALYPPEYIETTILEEEGLLRGRYYGRYRVSDRAISPEVRFYFEGRPQPDGATLEWEGGGGARGEIRLKLLGEHSLEVNWSATELGSKPSLAAGTAVLVRRIE